MLPEQSDNNNNNNNNHNHNHNTTTSTSAQFVCAASKLFTYLPTVPI